MAFLNKLQDTLIPKQVATTKTGQSAMDRAGENAMFPEFTNQANNAASVFIRNIANNETAPADLYDNRTGKLTTDTSELDGALLAQDIMALGNDDFTDYMYCSFGTRENEAQRTYHYDANQDEHYETNISYFTNDSDNSVSQYYIDEQDSEIDHISYTLRTITGDLPIPPSEYMQINYDNYDMYSEDPNHTGSPCTGYVYSQDSNSVRVKRGNVERVYNIKYDESGAAKSFNLIYQEVK